MENLKPTDTHIPFRDKDGVIRMYEIPAWWKGGVEDVRDTVSLVKKGVVEEICKTPGNRPVYLVRYGKKNEFKRTANYSSAVGAENLSCYADKSAEDYVPTVCLVGACHGGEFEGTVAINNLIKNIETGTDYAGNENKELMEAIKGVNLLLIPCVNMDGRARLPLKTMAGQSYEMFRYYSQGTWKDGSLCLYPKCKEVHPLKDHCDFLGGYYNDDGVNTVHDNFFFPMAEETKALFRVADEYVPDITIHLHGGGNCIQTFYLFSYMPKPVRDTIEALSQKVDEASKQQGIPYYHRQAKDDAADGRPSFNINSAWTALCGEPCITYETNQGLLFEEGRWNWQNSYSFETIYQAHKILFQETANFVKECRK